MGAVLDGGMLHPGRTGRNHLRALAKAAGLPDARTDELLQLVALTDAANRRAGGYSLGMRQRLGLAAALLGDPRVLVLDEPANGLDPQGIRWLRDFLRSLAREGRAVLVSSHVLAEVSQTADDVVVINRGRSVAQGTLTELIARSGGGMRVAGPDVRRLRELLVAAGARRQRRHRHRGARSQRRGHRAHDRRAPARGLRADAGRLIAGGSVLRAHRRKRRSLMTRLIGAELFKLRTTRTFYGVVGGAFGLVFTIVIIASFDGHLEPRRHSHARPARDRRLRAGLRARARHRGADARVPPRDDHARACSSSPIA